MSKAVSHQTRFRHRLMMPGHFEGEMVCALSGFLRVRRVGTYSRCLEWQHIISCIIQVSGASSQVCAAFLESRVCLSFLCLTRLDLCFFLSELLLRGLLAALLADFLPLCLGGELFLPLCLGGGSLEGVLGPAVLEGVLGAPG